MLAREELVGVPMADALVAQIESLRERLLDTTTRNRLLHYGHPSRGCARFFGTTLDDAFARLTAGQPLTIEPIPEPRHHEVAEYWRAQGRDDAEEKISAERWAKHLGINADLELADRGPGTGQRLISLHYRTAQEALLKRLRSAARTALEESGANLLFLAFGFLQWRDKADAARSFQAPLLLVPVELVLARPAASGTPAFKLAGTGEDLQWNRSLARKLDLDFGRKLPEPVLGEDEPPERPTVYLERVRQATEGLAGWAVRPYLTLGLFDFGAFLLWRDLDPGVWPAGAPLTGRPLIRRLLGAEPEAKINPSGSTRDVDEHVDLDLPLVDRADGSQARAILRAAAGETMLVEGPPGTGKSQTITNLIATALDQGKRVLFVSEKLAALAVVRRRIDALGLGEFCLELHSEKARKRALLDELERSLKRRRAPAGSAVGADLAVRLRQARAELAAYDDALLTLVPGLDRPGHQVLTSAAVLRGQARDAGLLPTLGGLGLEPGMPDRLARVDARSSLEVIGRALAALGGVAATHPWAGVDATLVQPFEADELLAALAEWAASLRALVAAVAAFEGGHGWHLGGMVGLAERCAEAGQALERWQRAGAACDRAADAIARIGGSLRCVLQPCAADLVLALRLTALAREAPSPALPLRAGALADPATDGLLTVLADRLGKAADAARALPHDLEQTAWNKTPATLRAAAKVLKVAGPFGFLRTEVREARRLTAGLFPGSRGASARQHLRALAEAIEARRNVESFAAAQAAFGPAFRGIATDVEALRGLRAWVARSVAALSPATRPDIISRFLTMGQDELAGLAAAAPALQAVEPLVRLAPDPSWPLRKIYLERAVPEAYRSLLAGAAEPDHARRALETVRVCAEAARRTGDGFAARAGLDERLWPAGREKPQTAEALLARVDRALAKPDQLGPWLRYDLTRRRAVGPLASHLVAAAERSDLPFEHLPLAFDHLLLDHAARAALREHPELRRQDGTTLAGLARRFAELDEELMEGRRAAIAARLRQVPRPSSIGFRSRTGTMRTTGASPTVRRASWSWPGSSSTMRRRCVGITARATRR